MSGLDDLLAGVAGFSKPSMASLKQQQGQGTPVQASAASFGAQPAAAPPASSGRPPVAAAAQRDPFAAEQLEQVIRTQSSSALAQQRCVPHRVQAVGGRLDRGCSVQRAAPRHGQLAPD